MSFLPAKQGISGEHERESIYPPSNISHSYNDAIIGNICLYRQCQIWKKVNIIEWWWRLYIKANNCSVLSVAVSFDLAPLVWRQDIKMWFAVTILSNSENYIRNLSNYNGAWKWRDAAGTLTKRLPESCHRAEHGRCHHYGCWLEGEQFTSKKLLTFCWSCTSLRYCHHPPIWPKKSQFSV